MFPKIMEKMVNNRLQWYLEKHKLYNPNQSGFRKNRNTMEQEIGLYERGSLGFLPFLWIGIIIECFQSFGISFKKHI
jgi:predicted Abi (CAAX) family protease